MKKKAKKTPKAKTLKKSRLLRLIIYKCGGPQHMEILWPNEMWDGLQREDVVIVKEIRFKESIKNPDGEGYGDVIRALQAIDELSGYDLSMFLRLWSETIMDQARD